MEYAKVLPGNALRNLGLLPMTYCLQRDQGGGGTLRHLGEVIAAILGRELNW